MTHNITSEAKLFADNTSLFTVVYDVDIAADKLNRDLEIISNWTYQWKTQFNPDKNKQEFRLSFPRKKKQLLIRPCFSMGLKLLKRSISIKYVSRDVLDQIYKLYVRPHLDYGDIIYHKYDPEFKLEFIKGLESTQYSAALAVSGAWRGSNTDKPYEKLGWEILYYRRWYGRLCHFHKLRNVQRPLYFYSEIPQERTFYHNLRRANVYEANAERTNRFSHTFPELYESETNWMNLLQVHLHSVFKRELMRLIRPPKRSLFGFHDIAGVRLLTHLRVEFSDLREHNFQCSSPMCFC